MIKEMVLLLLTVLSTGGGLRRKPFGLILCIIKVYEKIFVVMRVTKKTCDASVSSKIASYLRRDLGKIDVTVTTCICIQVLQFK